VKPAIAAAGLCALLIAGCAPMAPRPQTDPATELRWSQHRAALGNVLGFALSGRVAESGGRSAELRWRQFADARFALQLSGPFGVGHVAIEGDPGGVWVRTKDGSQYTDDPQAWMRTNLGWWLPLDDLRAWALGLPAPGEIEQLSLDADGRLATLQQHGWTVRYDGYQRVGSLELPRKLEAQTENVRLRLVVDSWTAVDLAKRS
jgi:outer membrane lipoprotein LolB